MAEAYWGVPDAIWKRAETYLDERLKSVVCGYYAATADKEGR